MNHYLIRKLGLLFHIKRALRKQYKSHIWSMVYLDCEKLTCTSHHVHHAITVESVIRPREYIPGGLCRSNKKNKPFTYLDNKNNAVANNKLVRSDINSVIPVILIVTRELSKNALLIFTRIQVLQRDLNNVNTALC
ncbi:hypothetical protein PHYBLDRAFT_161028 [Phycomyces blakesleeanus NRRL 1555(-)]|uniref:Uncharacterized protein n=1 Tax=Phycomyces blakesleeanus (strain ATCC 8743b / DSM 1359 / FGSC 10004 / NBRC 33097 / NRRL 1555) TaxID=763407 RepID=A0A162V6N2_PHYB8|nr:hypothetical protein PHYBLDRAFT_161028 [Phycomyces blakesleeanus NRRL 1555(-)]OAD80382.1 hypothetical protein PHYBLDRAFT_161028 [Phycomyces blakesleeanus NRRL 1555(-)]|eukprot:XP_018298422.1 hypothetical protein PHYBLDRAFT_161028 [Phycomyces blakesleeanus NRRL 1555(-)]